MIHLEITAAGKTVRYPVNRPLTLGRTSETADLAIDDKSCSRSHCRVEPAPLGVLVKDLGSSNGTYVDGERIEERRLTNGRSFTIGATEIRVVVTADLLPAKKVDPDKTPPPLRVVRAVETAPPPPRAPVAVDDSETDGLEPAIGATESAIRRRPAAHSSWSSRSITVLGVVVLTLALGWWGLGEFRKHSQKEADIAAARSRIDRALEEGRLADAVPDLKFLAESDSKAEDREKADARLLAVRARIAAAEGDKAWLDTIAVAADGVVSPEVAARLEGVARDSDDRRLRKAAEERLEALRQRRKSAVTAAFAAAQADVEQAIRTKRFGAAKAAVETCRPAVEKSGADADRDRLVSERAKVEAAALAFIETSIAEANELAKRDEVTTALALMQTVVDACRGTETEGRAVAEQKEFRSRMGERAYAISAEPRVGPAATKPADDRDRVPSGVDSVIDAERLASSAEWAAAALAFGRAAESVRTKEEKNHCERRRFILSTMAGLRRSAIETINAKVKTISVHWLGLTATVVRADEDSVEIHLGDSGKAVVRWKDLGPDRLWDILDDCAMTPELRVALVAVGHQNGKRDQAEGLATVIAKDGAKKESLDKLWAACRDIDVPAGGFVAVGARYLTPGEAETTKRNLKAKTLAEELIPANRSRAATITAELRDLGAEGLPALKIGLREREKDLVAKLLRHPKLKDPVGPRAQLVEAIEKARKEALALINDAVKYPYPYAPNQAEVQSEVDGLVDRVRALWERPFDSVIGGDPALGDLLDSLRDVATTLGEMGEKSETIGETATAWNKKLELERGSQSAAQLKWNDEVDQVNAERKSLVSNDEWEVHRLVNEYRVMMGLRKVKVDESLVRAARGHSQEMHDLGYFAHNSPTKGLETPGQRAKKEGFGGPVGENIAQGQDTPKGAFLGWTHSSGHHRNILDAGWNALGVGKSTAGNQWTQNFGSGAGVIKQAPNDDSKKKQ